MPFFFLINTLTAVNWQLDDDLSKYLSVKAYHVQDGKKKEIELVMCTEKYFNQSLVI